MVSSIRKLDVIPGRCYRGYMPFSEACMHLGVAGRLTWFKLVIHWEPMVQLYARDDNTGRIRKFSFPITTGEAGVYHKGSHKDYFNGVGFYYYPDLHNRDYELPARERFANTRVRVTHLNYGPRADPHGGIDIAVTRYGVRHLLTLCDLRGIRYCRYDAQSIKPTFKTDWEYDGPGYDAIMDEFVEVTGARPGQWQDWYHRHIHLNDPISDLGSHF